MGFLRSNVSSSKWEAHLIFVYNALCFKYIDFQAERVRKIIGDVLKRTRAIYGYKANEMSGALGISPSYLSEIENNKKQPSLELLKKYADIYGIKVSSLILLSENLDEIEKSNKSSIFIRNMMMHLIDGISKNVGDPDEIGTK